MLRPDHRIERVYLHRAPIDMRRQIDGLAALVEGVMKANPFDASLFVFINKRRNKLKILTWEKTASCSGTTNWFHTTALSSRSDHFKSVSRRTVSARWVSWFQRLHCLVGTCGPGGS